MPGQTIDRYYTCVQTCADDGLCMCVTSGLFVCCLTSSGKYYMHIQGEHKLNDAQNTQKRGRVVKTRKTTSD